MNADHARDRIRAIMPWWAKGALKLSLSRIPIKYHVRHRLMLAHHGAMTKPEIMALMKKTFQSAEEAMATLSDAQMLEPVKFPFGDRTVTRATFWQGPLYQLRNHYGQLVVYLRMNGIVPPASRR